MSRQLSPARKAQLVDHRPWPAADGSLSKEARLKPIKDMLETGYRCSSCGESVGDSRSRVLLHMPSGADLGIAKHVSTEYRCRRATVPYGIVCGKIVTLTLNASRVRHYPLDFRGQNRDFMRNIGTGALGYGGMRTGWLGWVVLVSAALIAGTPHSFADEIAPTGEYKEGLPLGGWMLFPSVFLGAVYNYNLAQAPQGTPTENAFGVRAVPRLVGTYDGGIYKTTVYGVVDGDFYHDNASNSNFFDTNTLSASAGFAEALPTDARSFI